jgi:hypothetical protein
LPELLLPINPALLLRRTGRRSHHRRNHGVSLIRDMGRLFCSMSCPEETDDTDLPSAMKHLPRNYYWEASSSSSKSRCNWMGIESYCPRIEISSCTPSLRIRGSVEYRVLLQTMRASRGGGCRWCREIKRSG